MTTPPHTGTPLRPGFAVRVARDEGRWRCTLLAPHADEELPALERALDDPAPDGGPAPFVVVVDSRLYLVVLRRGGDGAVRALISDATSQEWLLAAEVVERFGIEVDGGDTVEDLDDAGHGRPGGDLDLLADAGLPAAELTALLEHGELWADELALELAARLGFADELRAVAAA